ncbi:phosphatase PAP2 family protein [Knoellia sp. p5-6-4]|uniref:phosphatase PAP2 family protein n=1 Tax=unclassified Knoellia TaxID=2618719 RepID=UPI0023D9D417|nr:phosphatase PAP2 family protein [Knoellia sp. p5-6-4]MDF2146284.1 phosphatase PAP2 family protein [Knoellia sp. p5-6-4]
MRLRGDTLSEERIGQRDLAQWRSEPGRWLVRVAFSLARWTAARWVLVVTAAIGGVLVVLLTSVSAEVYEAVTENDGVAGLDQPVLEQAVRWRSPGLNEAVTAFTDIGGAVGMPVLVTVAVLAMVLLWRSWTPLVLTLVAAAGSLAMTVSGKELIGRARPPLHLAVPPYEESPSFPSGHTLNSTVLIGLLVYLLLRRLDSARVRAAVLVAGGAFVGAMGLSRVFLGHHWLTDVMVGWTLGLAWLIVVVTAHRLFLTVRRARGEEAAGAQASSAVQESPARVNPNRS